MSVSVIKFCLLTCLYPGTLQNMMEYYRELCQFVAPRSVLTCKTIDNQHFVRVYIYVTHIGMVQAYRLYASMLLCTCISMYDKILFTLWSCLYPGALQNVVDHHRELWQFVAHRLVQKLRTTTTHQGASLTGRTGESLAGALSCCTYSARQAIGFMLAQSL